MPSRFSFTQGQTSPPALKGGGTIAVLVVIVIIVMLHPTPALITACASLALAVGAAGVPIRRSAEEPSA